MFFSRNIMLFILSGLVIGLSSEHSYAASTGKKSPDFTLTDAEGNEKSLSKLVGKPVLLLFADESEISEGKLSNIAETYDFYFASELEIISIVVGKNSEEALEYQDELWLPFTLYSDPEGKIAQLYGIGQFPQVAILDNSHVVRYAGDYDTNDELHRKLLKWMDENLHRLPNTAWKIFRFCQPQT